MKIRASDSMKQMKNKLICVNMSAAPLFHHLLQSWKSLCFLFFYSTLFFNSSTPQNLILFQRLLSQFQHLWRKSKREKGISQPSRCLFLVQRQNLESLSTERTPSSAESPYAPGEGWLPSLWKGKEEQGGYGSVPRCGGGIPIAHLFLPVQSWLGRRQRVKESCSAFPVLWGQTQFHRNLI